MSDRQIFNAYFERVAAEETRVFHDGREVRKVADLPVQITCPFCGHTSHNANDVAQRYCGHCHVFIDDEVKQREWTLYLRGQL